MAISTEIGIDSAIKHISKGIKQDLEDRIKKELMLQAEEIVEQVAKSLCDDLAAFLSSYRQFDGQVSIGLVIDRVNLK